MRKMNRLLCVLLCIVMMLNLSSCIIGHAIDLMEGVEARQVEALEDLSAGNIAATDFALRLFLAADQGRNTLLSPVSVLSALAMTANGASGETLSEMERTLGMNREMLNEYIFSYVKSLPQGEKYKLKIANSIWIKEDDRFTVNPEFLQANADYFGAGVLKTTFNDKTLFQINSWVREKTDGMINKAVDKIPGDAIMYLVNALAFDAQWPEYFKSDAVHDGAFTDAYGEEHRARFMYSNVYSYLEDENAVGFIKNYSGSKYAFAAILPNEGINVNDYLAGLDGEKLNSLLLNPKRVTVKTSIPKFEAEFDSDISSVLADMGMSLAFDSERADFSEMGSYFYGSERVNIFISRVLHKTKIQVGEQGTKAGAVTVVEMSKDTAPDLGEVKTVYLNRPFIYMIIDCENAVPIFLGVINEL